MANDSSTTTINKDCIIQEPVVNEISIKENSHIVDAGIDDDLATHPNECSLSFIDDIKKGKHKIVDMDACNHRKHF